MKILVVSECSELNTGYGIVCKNLIRSLIDDGHDVTELSLFIDPKDPKLKNIKWKYIVNEPESEEDKRKYYENRFNLEGMWSFDRSLLEIKPDIIIENRDPYSYQYQLLSPFRDYFNWFIFAPVDGIEQPYQWRETMLKSDGVFTISKWGQSVLEGYNIPVSGTVYHSAEEGFKPLDKEEIVNIKKTMGIDGFKIVGTVMRNQPRKLFPSLFEGFRKYLDKTGDNTLLYCHTKFPDGGWDIPSLLTYHNLTSKVLFTYFCVNCKKTHSSIYKDIGSQCPFCRKFTAKLGHVFDSISTDTMNVIYNMFDLYIQLACREGFGIPQIEAAAANIPIVTTDYAGMSDVGRKLGAHMIKPASITHTHGMQMYEAALNSDDVAEAIKYGLNNPYNSREYFDKNFGSWKKNFKPLLENVNRIEKKKDWNSPPEIIQSEEYKEIDCSTLEYVKYLYYKVLCKPEWFGDYCSSRMINDLNMGSSFGGTHGIYFIESSNCSKMISFNRKMAYDICKNYRDNLNLWEDRRVNYV
jgi:glycosyltransferase involved in cell wall biosynthesis